MTLDLVNTIVLGIHLVAAMFFVGGSLFVWLVLIPASYRLTDDEGRRTEIVGKVARRFGHYVGAAIVILVVTGIYNATWYLDSFSALFSDTEGRILCAKIIAVILLFALIAVHDIYFSRRIGRLAWEGKEEELHELRRRSRAVSAASVVMMGIVIALVMAMHYVE